MSIITALQASNANSRLLSLESRIVSERDEDQREMMRIEIEDTRNDLRAYAKAQRAKGNPVETWSADRVMRDVRKAQGHDIE